MSDISIPHSREQVRENQRQADERKDQVEDLKAQHERKLEQLRDDYKKREADTSAAGQAAVNHIKKTSDERVEQVRENADESLAREAERANSSYNKLKNRVSEDTERLEQKTVREQERANQAVSKVRSDEAKTLARTQERMREFLEAQNELRTRSSQEAGKELDQTRKLGNERVTQAKAQANSSVATIEHQQAEKISELKEKNRIDYETTRTQAQARLEGLRRESDQKTKSELDRSNRSISSLQNRTKDTIALEQKQGEARLETIRNANELRTERAKEDSLRTNESMQVEYSQEAQRVQQTGEADIRARQERFEGMKREQTLENQKQLSTLQETSTQKQEELRVSTETRRQFEASKLEDGLAQQRGDFQERYKLNDAANKQTLHNQKEQFLRELYKSQQKLDGRGAVANARKDDPFYQMKSFNAELYERDGAYFLRAKVAPHEKGTVDIIVKSDRIVLSAKRSFADTRTDEDGDRTTTNSHQTYRQEFKLESPIIADKAIRRINDDGTINIIAPKKGKA